MTALRPSPPLGPCKVRVVNRPDLENVWRLDRGALPMILEMENNGMRIDKGHLSRLKIRLIAEMETLAAKSTELSGHSINIGSADQLANLLFDVLKLKQNGREKWTKSRVRLAADSDVLKAMVSSHPCIKVMLDWKERGKLLSTYTDSLIAQADEDERIHSDLSTTTAETGRLTSSNPNLQNIPIRTELGTEIRNAFIPSLGNKIGSVDASQIEMRMNAVDAQCQNLLACFWGWEDVYWHTAELVNHMDFPEDIRESDDKIYGPDPGTTAKKWYRQNAKVIALMVGYDASPMAVYDKFLTEGVPGWTEHLCGVAVRDYFEVYPELLTARKIHHKRAYVCELVWDMWGRTRWIGQVRSVHKRIVGEGLRQAGNLAGQGGAAGIIKLWMAVIWVRYDIYWRKHGIRMLMQIHDELLAEGPEQVLKDFLQECYDALRRLIPYEWFNCPLEAGWGIGDSWGACKH